MDSPTTLGARQELIVGKPVYDLAGRLVAVKQYDGTLQSDTDILTEFTYTYADKTNYLTEKTMDLPTHDLTATYAYGDAAVGEMPDQVYNVYYDSWSSVDYAYDALGRLTDETLHVALGYTIDNSYTYLDVNADRTTTLVSTCTTKTGTYSYTYDAVGKITQIVFTPTDTRPNWDSCLLGFLIGYSSVFGGYYDENKNLISELQTVPAFGHSYNAVVTAPTCTDAGSTTYTCTACGDSYVSDYFATLSHKKVLINDKKETATEDGYTCDIVCSVCGTEIEKGEVIPATGEKTTNCSHICHKDGIMGIFWKIMQFFWKIFGMNPVCECGAAHY